MKHIGIVMSAGKGLRMGSDVPKQYMDLDGKPVLFYALNAMQESFIDEIIIVVGEGSIDFVSEEIVKKYGFSKVTQIVEGGAERSDSVYNGLLAVKDPDNSYVYIQDGARPCLTTDLLWKVKEDVECFGTAVVGVKSKDTVKLVGPDGFVATTPSREWVWNVQTPQTFVCSDILDAYDKFRANKNAVVTDDASVMEQFGKLPVHITEGDYRNVKITTSEDILLVQNFL